MAAISTSDVVFATLSNYRGIIANIRLSGISSFEDVCRALRSQVGAVPGLSRLDIRNSSQGWCDSRSVMMR